NAADGKTPWSSLPSVAMSVSVSVAISVSVAGGLRVILRKHSANYGAARLLQALECAACHSGAALSSGNDKHCGRCRGRQQLCISETQHRGSVDDNEIKNLEADRQQGVEAAAP